MKRLNLLRFFPVLCMLPLAVYAGPVLTLEAGASGKVPNDEMMVTVGTVSSGHNVAALNEEVLSALNAAIRQAQAVPGVKAQLGSVHTQQAWRDGKQVGWEVHGELLLTSQNMSALAKLSGNLGQQLQLRGVSFHLSENKRRAEETRLLNEAAANFRSRAQAATQAFGYRKYEIEELSLNSPSRFPGPRPMMEMSVARTSAAPLPAEGGNTEVQVTVSGRIRID